MCVFNGLCHVNEEKLINLHLYMAHANNIEQQDNLISKKIK